MYLDLGEKTSVMQKDILGVFDIDATTVSHKTRDYLNKMQKDNKLITVSYDLPLSFVVCENEAYLCAVSTQTLYSRTLK